MSRTERADAGFTLIEVMVALAIFGLAALTLLKLLGVTMTGAATLEQRAVGQIVARNVAIEVLTDPVTPAFGTSNGIEDNGGLSWRWTRQVERMPESRLQKITVNVMDPAGDQVASLMLIRRAL